MLKTSEQLFSATFASCSCAILFHSLCRCVRLTFGAFVSDCRSVGATHSGIRDFYYILKTFNVKQYL